MTGLETGHSDISLQNCDLRWVGAAFDGRGASKNDWLLLKRISRTMCSSGKTPRRLREGRKLEEGDEKYQMIIN